MSEEETPSQSQKQTEKELENKPESKQLTAPDGNKVDIIDWEKKWKEEMEARTELEKELDTLRKFKDETERKSRQQLINDLKKVFPDLEIKDDFDDAYLKGLLLGAEKLKEVLKKKEPKGKPIPSSTGEPPKEKELWEEILD